MIKMKKKISLMGFTLLCSIFMINSVHALRPYEIKDRNICEKVELAIAKADGSLESISCYGTYQEAKNIMEQTNHDDLVIIESGVIVDAKYALIDYDVDYRESSVSYTSVYASNTSNREITYIRTTCRNSICYADDAALLEVDYQNKRVKIKVAGVTGWIKEYAGSLKLYDIVPISWTTSPQYYQASSDRLEHHFPQNVYNDQNKISYTIDRKPTMLKEGKYYSYDGNYFYKDLKTMLKDYKNNTYENSVNHEDPYYNYYQYLSFRTKTSYSAENLNEYLNLVAGSGKMANTGEAFIQAQEAYGINAVLMMSVGLNESGLGKSSLAMNKNNLFGLNAIDANPGLNADAFLTVGDCINDYAYQWLSYGYADPEDYRYYGANLGNKGVGANVKYASDPFWAEKAASYYYQIDKRFSFQDHSSIKTAVLNDNYSNKVYAKKTIGGENVASFYQYKVKGSSISIIEELEGPSVNGNTTWYKIMSDSTLDENLNYIKYSTKPRNYYNWSNSFVYVPAAYFIKKNVLIEEPDDSNNSEKPIQPEDPVIPEKPPVKQISVIVTEASYKYSSGIISGIFPGTSVETLKSNLINTGGIVTITENNGNTKEKGMIGTGYKVNITSGITETLTVLIHGDLTGDGLINSADLLRMRQHLLGTPLSGIYEKAAYMGYNTINSANLLKIRQYLLGQAEIAQK